MQFFSEENGKLIFRGNGEMLVIEPWGRNSLRVRSVFLGDVIDQSAALLPPDEKMHEVKVVTHDEKDTKDPRDSYRSASITNGKIAASCYVQPWGDTLQIVYSEVPSGKVLLKEISNNGALCTKARSFKRISGDVFKLRAKFESDPDEKLYGMGQYQQERMNLKGCNLELAHRNSQASVPFVLSDKGYGFLWAV